jgi:hypothetical protein
VVATAPRHYRGAGDRSHTIDYEAEQHAARAQAIIRALAITAHEHMRDNHWLYCFEALDRLLAPVCEALTTLTWELMESSSDTQEATEVAGSQPLKTEEGN